MLFFCVLRKEPEFPFFYKPEDYLAASEYTICDDGRRPAGAYFSAQARNKHKSQTTHATTTMSHNFIFAKAGGRKTMYVFFN